MAKRRGYSNLNSANRYLVPRKIRPRVDWELDLDYRYNDQLNHNMRRFTLRTVSLFQRKFFSNPKWRPPNFHRGRMLPFKIKEK